MQILRAPPAFPGAELAMPEMIADGSLPEHVDHAIGLRDRHRRTAELAHPADIPRCRPSAARSSRDLPEELPWPLIEDGDRARHRRYRCRLPDDLAAKIRQCDPASG